MAVSATQDIDRRLAELYAEKITVNLDNHSSLSPEDFWKSMYLIANNNKALMNFNKK